MSGYEHTDEHGYTLKVVDGNLVTIGMPGFGASVRVPAAERQAAAQALAGDEWRVVPAKQDPESFDHVDTSDIEVEGTGDELWAGSGPERCGAHVRDNPNWLRNHARNALALARELERPAEPEPDPEQVEALAGLLKQVDEDLDMYNVIGPENYARELVRRGVTIGGAS